MDLPEISGRIAHYDILERLGSGGMGVVYKARDVRLGRVVALKFMGPGRDASDEARQRFLREARAVAALDHPNVCTLFEIGEAEDGRIFLAMALCPGETLRSRLRRGPLPPEEAVGIAVQVADGLSAAHARGIIHRDIKPGNLLVGEGPVRIVDFGVARLGDQTTITREGAAVGTMSYTAPEQLFGGEVGPAADLWSLGVVLYESIAGRLPFQAKSMPEMILAILKKTAPPLEGVGPELRRVVERALTRSPRLRYQTAEEMRDDLLAAAATLTDGGSKTWNLRVPPPVRAPVRATPRLPLIHNLPFPPLGDLLKGRSADLQTLEEAVSAGVRNHVLHGLGGIGKTRLAVEYAWAHRDRYRAELFVLADSPEGLNSGLAALARTDLLNLPERDASAENEVMGAVLRWLRENPGWLLLLDNVDTREALLAVTRLLPSLAGHVLITSRRRDWPAAVQRQPIDVIALAAATDFLLKRTIKERRRELDDVPQALRLAELLDGLPLALEQAAAYICHTGLSFAEYLEVWECECDSALSWYDEGVMQYPASLAVTWQKTFRELAPTAKALLRLSAYLASDPIPVEMLESSAAIVRAAAQQLCTEPGQEIPSRHIRDDLGELVSLSMISRQGSLLSIHRVVQEVMRQRIPEMHRRAWIQWTMALVVQYAPLQADDPENWPIWDLVRSHALEILSHATEAGASESLAASRLMTEVAVLLYWKSLYSEAEPLFRQALEIDLKLFGTENPEVSVDYVNLAELLQKMGRLEEAEPLIRSALKIDRAAFGDQHPNVARDLNSLALLLGKTDRWTEAEELLRRALAIDQNAYHGDHGDVARDLHNLAFLLTSMGRTTEAEPLIRRALDIGQTTHGRAHPKTARKLQVLASILRDQGQRTAAEPLARQSLEIFEQVLGPDHPSTQSARRDLEAILAHQDE